MKDLQGKRILFCVPENNVETNGVYASQVLGLARYCAKIGAKCLVFQYSPAGGDEFHQFEPGIDVLTDRLTRPFRPFVFQTRDLRRVINRFREQLLAFSPTSIYCRQYQSCRAARELADAAGATLIYSMRGPEVSEALARGGIKGLLSAAYVSVAVRDAMKKCDRFQTMSVPFAKWNKKKYGREAVVYQCCVTDRFWSRLSAAERLNLRSKLGFLETDTVIVWCGAYFAWQRTEDIVRLMHQLHQRDSSVKALFILKSTDRIAKYCRECGFDETGWRAVALKPQDVPAHLQACDVGINCLAVDDFRSQIVSPIKVGEYLASELPILVTRTMGDVPGFVKKFGVGEILPDHLEPDEVLKQVKKALSVDRHQCVACAQACYSWEGNRDRIVELFS